MPKRTDDPRKNQSLVRFTESEWATLTALAHLEGITPNRLIRSVVVSRLEQAVKDPAVRADIDNRAAYKARLGGTVVPMRAKP